MTQPPPSGHPQPQMPPTAMQAMNRTRLGERRAASTDTRCDGNGNEGRWTHRAIRALRLGEAAGQTRGIPTAGHQASKLAPFHTTVRSRRLLRGRLPSFRLPWGLAARSASAAPSALPPLRAASCRCAGTAASRPPAWRRRQLAGAARLAACPDRPGRRC
eukprot:364098-Chlamydomonas_euryale.AAC.2